MSGSHTYTPLWPEVERLIAARQPGGRMPRPNADGWIGAVRSPIRDGDTNPSFSVLPDSETNPGAFIDHATTDQGSMADLARLLGVKVGGNGAPWPVIPPTAAPKPPTAPPRPTVTTLESFAAARKFDPVQLHDLWGVREGSKSNRRGLIYPTTTGVDRVKFFDGAKPKYSWVKTGGYAHLYGLERAVELADRAPESEQGTVFLVNGEPSVWACSQEGVPAVCLCGEGTTPTPELVAELAASGFDTVRVVYDTDDAGRRGAAAALVTLRASGLAAEAYELPSEFGDGGDVDDLHQRDGAGLAAALGALPVFDPSKPIEKPSEAELSFEKLWNPVNIGGLTNPPPRRSWLLTLPDGEGGDGLLPRGKVGILSAAGGTGKTAALVSLAVAAITGRPWFGYYRVPPTVTGRVLLLLAEESDEDAYRRIWKVADALKLTGPERVLLDANLVAIPLAGKHVALTAMSGSGLIETPLAGMLRERLVRDAGDDGWSLIGIDPLSRFAGGDVESSNEAATRYIEALESITTVPGNPTVIVSAHSSKFSRRQGQTDVRGVTGISDAARWVATLSVKDKGVTFEVVKSNYSLPCPPLRLRWRDETLVAISGAEALDAEEDEQMAQDAQIDDDIRRVVEILTKYGTMTSRETIASATKMKATRGRAAVDLAVAKGIIVRSGTDRHWRYDLAASPSPDSHTPAPPVPPSPSGTDRTGGISPSQTSRDESGRNGTDRDGPGGVF